MHDIWNPWHGCVKYSEGCKNCYMYVLDKMRNQDGSHIYKTNDFAYPLSRNRDGTYKIQSGEKIRVCMTSDFCLEEADIWRDDVWSMIRRRQDVIFYILTKRAERLKECLPDNWGEGYENVILNVTCENQKRADERIPILLDIPAKHKGVMLAPLIGPIDLEKYLDGRIEEVTCGGENYGGTRACDFDWIKSLHNQCVNKNTTFTFIETGSHFVKDGIHYRVKGKVAQTRIAYRSRMNYQGKKPVYHLYDFFDNELREDQLYKREFSEHCIECASKPICNGCARRFGCKQCL